MAVQQSVDNLALLCRAALPGLTGDVVVPVALAALGAVCVCEPSISRLRTRRGDFWNLQKNPKKTIKTYLSECTYRAILSILVITSALAERHTFVSTEDETGVADTSLHAGKVARAARACRILTGGLATGRNAWFVLTVGGALQS